MKQKITIYPDRPYVAMVGKRAIHLNEKQYKAIVEDMGAGKGTTVITYHDPVRKESREIPLNLYKIEMLDRAEVVREESWRAQGGYVCKGGMLVDFPDECEVKDGYKKYEQENKKFSGVNKIKKYNPQKFREAMEKGRQDGLERRMKNVKEVIEREGEEVFLNATSQYDKEGYRIYMGLQEVREEI